MGLFSAIAKKGGSLLAPRVGKIAPGVTGTFLDKVLDRAVQGGGPFDPAAEVADAARAEARDLPSAVESLISSHARLAAAQGFLTNIGGLVTLAVSVPANVTGLTLVQLRLHAAIAHLHGHDLADPGVRAAVLVTLLGHDETEKLVKKKDLPGNARWFLSASETGARTKEVVAGAVAARLVELLGGKQVATFLGKRIPLVGGIVGAASDGRLTSRLGREAAQDLAPA